MAKDSLIKASTPEPVGPKPLWHKPGMHLPFYIEHIANDIRERGHSEGEAIAIAISAVKKWAAGGKKVDKNTRIASAKAVAEWNADKARAKASIAVHKPGRRRG
jgi:hypothetical protein